MGCQKDRFIVKGLKMEFMVYRRTVVGCTFFCGLLLFQSLLFLPDADAQLFRRARAQRWQAAPVHHDRAAAIVDDQLISDRQNFQGGSITSAPTVSRLPKWPFGNGYDPRIHLDADRHSRYPKFIGGFHSSHFTNVGLPSGDIGFRGNGLYWTPW